jgi:hypothetical protein
MRQSGRRPGACGAHCSNPCRALPSKGSERGAARRCRCKHGTLSGRPRVQVHTVGVGVAIGQACMLLAAGHKGKRFMLPHATGARPPEAANTG